VVVIDLVGRDRLPEILDTVSEAAARDPGPAATFESERITLSRGFLLSRMIPDPAGYFVIFQDRPRGILSLEHYRTDGVLDVVIEGHSAAECYTPAIAQGLLSHLDHAAYLGRELARAEIALLTGAPYVQDAAAETESPPATGPRCCTGQEAVLVRRSVANSLNMRSDVSCADASVGPNPRPHGPLAIRGSPHCGRSQRDPSARLSSRPSRSAWRSVWPR
jgi:hypothetical protein